MKIFDMHIGLSDFVLETGANVSIKQPVQGMPLPNQFDVVRAKKGNLDIFLGMICPIIFTNGKAMLPVDMKKEIQKHIDIYTGLEEKGLIRIVKKRQDFAYQGLKVILGIEGVYGIDPLSLQEFFNEGIKVVGPMWNFENNLFKSPTLSSTDKEFLAICKEYNIIIDLAHSESNIFSRVIDAYDGMIIDSHTNVKGIYEHARCISDSQIAKIKQKNGVVAVSFVGEFLGGTTMEYVFSHIDYLVQKFGDEVVAIGSDFDGMDFSDLVAGLEDASGYQNLVNCMRSHGYTEATIRNICYENARRLFISTLSN